MQFTLNKIKQGDVLRAEVVELITDKELIVSFYGDLIRVANHSRQKLMIGQEVYLRVLSVNPFSFQLRSRFQGTNYRAVV